MFTCDPSCSRRTPCAREVSALDGGFVPLGVRWVMAMSISYQGCAAGATVGDADR
jgi:hypothetical protein